MTAASFPSGRHRIWIDHAPPAGVPLPDDVLLVAGPSGADGVVVGSTELWDAQACRRHPDLKVVARSGIGYDNVDVAACAALGVAACNTPDAPTVSTAEHALALLLAVTKRLRSAVGGLESGLGDHRARSSAIELEGLTLGLLGCGRIGGRMSRYGKALGMRVLVCDPYLDAGEPAEPTDLDGLWSRSDVISLHAPATPETHQIVNRASLARMRTGVVIINCARGSLIDCEALATALESGRVAGAGLDVTEPEPLPVGHRLLGRDDVLVTPHVASATLTGKIRLFSDALDQALIWLRGGTPEHLLDSSAADPKVDRRRIAWQDQLR